eukprot:Colp12_sorted_trinity150504_noHs@1235
MPVVTSPVVLDEEGNKVPLLTLWQDEQILLCFLRHLGCIFCHELAHGLNTIYDELTAKDIKVIVVSIGTPGQAREFKKITNFKGAIYVDPDTSSNGQLLSYDLFRLNHADKEIPASVWAKGAELKTQGFDNHPHLDGAEAQYTGNILQLGGIFLMGPGNNCDYSYRSKYIGDHPLIEDIKEAALGVNAKGDVYTYERTKTWIRKLSVSTIKNLPPKPQAEKKVTKSSEKEVAPSEPATSVASYAAALLPVAAAVLYTLYGGVSKSNKPIIAIAVVIGLALFVYLQKKSASSKVVHKLERKESQDEELQSTLYTPQQIDSFALDHGLLDCDCSSVFSNIDMLTNHSGSAPMAGSNSQECELPLVVPKWTPEVHEVYQKTLCYVRDFLAKSHPLVGRPGPTCPFVPLALRKNLCFLSVVNTGPGTTRRSLVKFVRSYLTRFQEIEPRTGKDAVYKAVILVFPDIAVEDAFEYIDGVQNELKEEFVENGLMIGEFHMYNNTPGMRNPDWYPLRTPYPSLAMRHMVPTDLVFLSNERYGPEKRKKFLEAYLRTFGSDADDANTKKNKKDVETAKQELEQATRALSGGL